MKTISRLGVFIMIASFLCIASGTVLAKSQQYRVVQMRAAPGKLLEVIKLIKEDMSNYRSYGIRKPYLMRHSQGDQWDLMMIYPVKSVSDHLSGRSRRKMRGSNTLEKPFGDPFYQQISWYQDSFAEGPPIRGFSRLFRDFSYYHIEIFTSLAGKQNELLRQRQMENVYLREIGRRPNLIFTRVAGAPWDIFTIGFYADIKDYASSADISNDVKNKAAKKAGFEGINTIGSYLRELILEHHDTLAGAVRP